MFIKKVISYSKLAFYRMKFGNRLTVKNIRLCRLCLDTEIVVGRDAVMSLGNIGCNSGLHLECYLGQLDIGDARFNRHCIISCRFKIKIGDNCFFGPNVCVYDHDHVYSVDGLVPDQYKCSEIIIEDGCWIGAGVIILRGTHIGNHSVIEAGAVVRGNIPPHSLVTSVRENRIIPTTIFLRNESTKLGENA